MKIAIADNNNQKFTRDLIEYWQQKGHEIGFNMGASEKLAQWADLYYVDTWDNNIHYLWKLYNGIEGVSRTPDWDNNKKPKIVCRVLDWEVWIGWVRDQKIIDWVDNIIFIAPHIQKRVNSEVSIPAEKQKLICPGVNLQRFALKSKQTDGFQLGMVLGDMWKYKNHTGGLDIFTTLYQQDKRWRLHVRGQHESGIYDPENWEYYLDSRGIRDVVTLYDKVDDMNEWYENIDILLHPGQKEAFCYAVGEAMAKDIPAVVNDFMGSKDIWYEKGAWMYSTNEEAISQIQFLHKTLGKYAAKSRVFIEKYYSLERMLKEYDEFLGL